jgi:hypothetical protein
LKSAHLKIDEQRKEIWSLKMEVTSLRRKVKSTAASKGRKPKDTAAKSTNDDRIALCARRFGIMNEVFVAESAFLKKDPDVDPMDPERYKTPDSILSGVVAELFEGVPENLHEMMQESGSFRDLVSILYYIRHYHFLK